jgi:hypothetical protein
MNTKQVIANAEMLCEQLKNMGLLECTFTLDRKNKQATFRYIHLQRTAGLGLKVIVRDEDISIKDLEAPMQQEDLEQWLMKICLEMS